MSKKRIVYQPTDVVLAKVKGFPAWPAMIVPEELIPGNVLKERLGKPTVDEIEDENNPDNYVVYNDHLKFRKNFKPHTSYCIKFFCDDSYIWLKPVDFKPLSAEQCTNWLQNSKKQTKKLIPAYEMAAKGPQGIDVWEFIEYGSQGKPEEEEYVDEEPEEKSQNEDNEEEEELLSEPLSAVSESDYDEGDKVRKGSRSSKRQAKAKAKDVAKGRKTRKRRAIYDEDDNAQDLLQELQEEPKSASRSKKKRPSLKVKIEVQKYKFEDDENWSIVGLGPQELSLSTSNSIVNKLSQKKNLEVHNEIKADLIDKLGFVNRLMSELVFKNSDEDDHEEYLMLIDELEQCSALRGSQDELVTVFLSDQELVINLNALFNLKQSFLREARLYDRLQEWFTSIFGSPFVVGPDAWTTDTMDGKAEHDSQMKENETVLNGIEQAAAS
ncbi:LAFA_0B03378g1_1 [Lachancea sp. 'fantastica']|nr:LAFA_0B03378g1_1 [Lachancea sp. 'fantastica']